MTKGTPADDPARIWAESLVNKFVPWKFMGHSLSFALSHALFSSHDIDAGSKLLLKTVAQQCKPDGMHTVLDLGCGVGVLGISLKARFPHLDVTAVDRDALAVEFTRRNARRNGWEAGEGGFSVLGSLGLRHLPDRTYDLILSNIPAKAGRTVIDSWLTGCAALLGRDGLLAVVIVKTLAPIVAEALRQAGHTMIFSEETREYTVFHARPARAWAVDRSLAPYMRGRMTLSAAGGPLELDTVTGLPEFDTLGYGTVLLRKITDRVECTGKVLLWNPGQGHLAALLWRRFGRRIRHVTLAGRDLLSLEISRSNCLTAGAGEDRLAVRHAPSLFTVSGAFDRVIMVPDADAGVPWHLSLLPSVLPRLAAGGVAALAARSSLLGRVDWSRSVRVLDDLKSRGFRGVAFRTKP